LNYSWTGPNGFKANTLTTPVKKGGMYTLTATDPANGCTTSASTTVEENTVIPSGLSINNTSSLTCLNKSVKVFGFSATPNARYLWTGPSGFSSTLATITAIRGGAYTFKVTDTINGCSDSLATTVIDNSKPPVVTITNTGPLSCSKRIVTLSANTTTPNVEYLWIGPDDFFAERKDTTTNIPGSYSVIVNVPATGCKTTEFTEVTGDISGCSRKSTDGGNTATANAQNAPGEVITKFVYKAYPNPVTLNGVIEFATPESTAVTVGLYNSLGVCEKVLFKGNAAAQQRYRLAVPAAQLQAGAYYYIINTGGRSYTGKLVIVR
jgi:hypothetical protein